jgi:hypothetical protein
MDMTMLSSRVQGTSAVLLMVIKSGVSKMDSMPGRDKISSKTGWFFPSAREENRKYPWSTGGTPRTIFKASGLGVVSAYMVGIGGMEAIEILYRIFLEQG